MENFRSVKSLVLVSALVLSLAFFAVACKKAEYVPTPVAPVEVAPTPATEIPTATAPVQ